jgi:hypothetical protein
MPTITNPNKHFDILTWSGTGGSASATRSLTGLNFQPDFVWEKDRASSQSHHLFDSVRGAGTSKTIASDSTAIQGGFNDTTYGYLSSFDSSGITTTNGSSTWDNWNKSGDTYIAWNWKANNGTTVTNTNGSVNSTVSLNATAGFSIVNYTVPSASSFTWGHGLPATPGFMMIKGGYTSQTYNWDVYHSSNPNTVRLQLNSSAANDTQSGVWQNTTPNSTVVTQGGGGSAWYATGSVNIAYCWTPIAGYSQFGSYTGNGSTDGPFVYLGFRPRFIMIKNTTNIQPWMMIDTARNTYNVSGDYLQCSSNGVEDALSTVSSSVALDILSNGFKLRNSASSSGYTNASGDNYVYAAWAEAPFQYANAR